MTAKDIGTRGTSATVRVRADGEVDEESLAYLREKVGTALDRPGLPPVSGEVRVARASAQHVELPWSAGADIRVGRHLVTVHAHEASARELADRLHDRLRAGAERVVHRGDTTRRTATPPPWRGGPQK
ncbi:hypothetical protein ACFQZ0_03745 [Streptomyces erythrogriseus]|uniref:Uncharacterized protein n=3 Tax=Streptomyces TaxID=1883 RepID=A0ABN3WDW2_9ACTN|nr:MULTISPECIES: hypothetical protein [Streptomyces]MDH3034200.1 hypothetical protein [Streptomyces sp. TRM75561]GGP64309.1 hypothetical protein GCM10010265_48210 [Streptomyces griseoincarnatus]GGT50600.1 hypothetical protein GCM10010287_25620 [Streptomyces variabilis]